MALHDMALHDPISSKALEPTLEKLLQHAKRHGAETADAISTHGRSLGVVVRQGNLEDVDNSEGRDIGLRVMVGKRQACVSSSDLSDASLDRLAERAVAMAKLAPEDPYCGLADKSLLSTQDHELDVYDSTEMSPQRLKKRALEVETAAIGVKGVQQAEGASASWSSSALYFMTSHGFSKGWRASRHALSVSAIAEQDGAMERDYDSHSTRWLEDLKSAQEIGTLAGERAIARLGSQQLASGAMPVMFDRRVSAALVNSLKGAITGPAIARGVSFLKDSMSAQIFSDNIQITDDPLRKRGQASRPWDGEGVAVKKQSLIKNGILQTWILNTASARQLKLTTTGHGNRGLGAPPGVGTTNTVMSGGVKTPEQLMADMNDGLLITEMFGPSLNSNTGDYSVGVAGFKIENGLRAYPVNEITIAGNLIEIYKTLIAANDLVFNRSTVAPSLLCEGITIAGS